MSKKIRLGVNIDHIATLREVRKAAYPDLLEAARLCKRAGADQITVHLREDRRHIQDQDVINLLRSQILPINLEMAYTFEMLRFAERWKPYSVTLVPERRAEMTTESGLDLKTVMRRRSGVQRLAKKTKIFGFVDADFRQVELAAQLELDGIEFHTGTFANVFEMGGRTVRVGAEIERLEAAAERAVELGLEVKAGHGLTLQNVHWLFKMPKLSELNIGHSIVSRSIYIGLYAAVREMKIKLKK